MERYAEQGEPSWSEWGPEEATAEASGSCVCMCMCVQVRGQLAGVGCFLPPLGSWELNSGWQAPTPVQFEGGFNGYSSLFLLALK